MAKYKNPLHQKMYDTLLHLAADPKSEMYTSDGRQHGGANMRCVFWDGFNGLDIKHRVPAGTPLAVAYAAGKNYARAQRGTSPRRRTVSLTQAALQALDTLKSRATVKLSDSQVVEQTLVAAAA